MTLAQQGVRHPVLLPGRHAKPRLSQIDGRLDNVLGCKDLRMLSQV